MSKLVAPLAALLMAAVTPAAALAQQAPATADEAAELAEARAIIAIMFPVEQRDATFHSMMQQLLGQLGQAVPAEVAALGDPGLTAILTRFRNSVPELVMPTVRAHLPRILDATAVAYAHEFDLAELRQIRAFAETPAGRHYLSRSSALLGDPAVAAANTAYFTDISALAQQEQRKLRTELTDYLAAHPDVAEKVANAARN